MQTIIDLNGLQLKNRFLASAGSLNYGQGYWHEKWCTRPELYGGVSTKTITLDPRQGFYTNKYKPWQVLRKVKGGWINALGWYNCGIDDFIENYYQPDSATSLIVSIGGFARDEYLGLVAKLNPLKIAGIELNFSCPNVHLDFLKEEDFEQTLQAIRGLSCHPLILKLSLDSDMISQAKSAEKVGINVLHAINTIKGATINYRNGKFHLNNKTGGISGKILKPFALRAVYELRQEVNLPIIAGGGIFNLRDCQAFRHVGANAFSFGSVHLTRPWQPSLLIWLSQYSKHKRYWHGS